MIRIPNELFEKGEGSESNPLPSFTSELTAARQAAALTRVSAESSRALHDLDRAVEESKADPANWADSFTADAQRLRDDHLAALPDPRLGEAFARDFDDLAAAKLAIVRRRAATREIGDARAHLDETLETYAGFAVNASSDVEAHIVHDQAEDSITRMDQAGYLRAGEADELRQSYAARQDTARLDRLIEADPGAAARALGDPARFPTLEPDARLRLRDRAQIRAEDQQREAAAAASTERKGRLAGLMVRLDADDADRTDIMQAVSEGWLQPTERDRALDLWNRRRDEIRQRDDAINRVRVSLEGEGAPLDTDDPRERAAIDTHFDDAKAAWLAAGLREDQLAPLIADYVDAAGILPNGVRRDISGTFRTGDPQARVRVADLIGQLPPEALKDIPQRDGAEALLIMALQKTGWPPDQAADRAASIMAGTIDPTDRFFDQDSAAIETMISSAARRNVQVASLRPDAVASDYDSGVISDVPPQPNGEVQLALAGPALELLLTYGLPALAAIFAAKTAVEGTRDALEKMNRSGEGVSPPQPLPPPPPLPTKEETPPQPNDLPNVPPPGPSSKEELVPEIIQVDTIRLPDPESNKPGIYIYVPPSREIGEDTIVHANENAATKAQSRELIERLWEEYPDAKEIKTEFWIPGTGHAWKDEHGRHGDGRPGGKFADVAIIFDSDRKPLLYQIVDVDKNNVPTDRELVNAAKMHQQGYTVALISKQWQVNLNRDRSHK